jgi:hypothetical protein
MCIIIFDDKKISFIERVVQWLKFCFLNMEVKGSERFKPSHLHPRLVGKMLRWARFLA